MVGVSGEVSRRERRGGGESGPLWRGAISHLRTQPHTLTHIYTSGDRAAPAALPSLWM